MNFSINTNCFTINNVSFMDSKQNIVMDGLFTKINYLSNWFTMNSIFFNIPIESKKIFTDDRCIIVFDLYAIINLPIIKLFTTIENELLDYYCYSKQKKLKKNLMLSKQLYNGNLKLNIENNSESFTKDTKILIKISGIWETADGIGITYKLFQGNTVINCLK